MPIPVQHPARPAPPFSPAAVPSRPSSSSHSSPSRPRPNYASRAETLKVAEEVMNRRSKLFRRLADA